MEVKGTVVFVEDGVKIILGLSFQCCGALLVEHKAATKESENVKYLAWLKQNKYNNVQNLVAIFTVMYTEQLLRQVNSADGVPSTSVCVCVCAHLDYQCRPVVAR